MFNFKKTIKMKLKYDYNQELHLTVLPSPILLVCCSKFAFFETSFLFCKEYESDLLNMFTYYLDCYGRYF